MSDSKDWTVNFSERARKGMAEDPEARAEVTEQLARIKQVMAEFEAGRFKTIEDALTSIGMEPMRSVDLTGLTADETEIMLREEDDDE